MCVCVCVCVCDLTLPCVMARSEVDTIVCTSLPPILACNVACKENVCGKREGSGREQEERGREREKEGERGREREREKEREKESREREREREEEREINKQELMNTCCGHYKCTHSVNISLKPVGKFNSAYTKITHLLKHFHYDPTDKN